MPHYRIVINGAARSGCDREAQEGQPLRRCTDAGCLDCMARAFVEDLQLAGHSVGNASLVHGPGSPRQVIDDLKAGRREEGGF